MLNNYFVLSPNHTGLDGLSEALVETMRQTTSNATRVETNLVKRPKAEAPGDAAQSG